MHSSVIDGVRLQDAVICTARKVPGKYRFLFSISVRAKLANLFLIYIYKWLIDVQTVVKLMTELISTITKSNNVLLQLMYM